MKKHLIAAAVAAAVAVPAAYAQVTVSGVLDLNPYSSLKDETTTTANTKTRGSNATNGWTTSNVGFGGTEDLGGGLRAAFFVNQAVDANGAFGARDRWISLSGGFGSLKVGRFTTAVDGLGGFGMPGATNTAGTPESSGHDFSNGTLGGGTTAGEFGRQNGVVQYALPKMGALNITLEMAQNSADNNAADRAGKTAVSQVGVRADYAVGQLRLGAAHASRKAKTEAAPLTAGVDATGTPGTPAVARAETESKLTWFGGSYNLGPAAITASYGTRSDDNELTGAVARDGKVTALGITVPMGAITLTASIYDGQEDRAAGTADDRDLEGYQLTARYALSKRTFFYLATGQNESNNKTTGTDAAVRTQTNVGLVHSF